jgi:hypothetical protein
MQELNMLHDCNFGNADIIVGVDEETGNEFVAFGAAIIHVISKLPDDQTYSAKVVKVEIIQRTAELEALLGTIKAARSYHDYAPAGMTLADVLDNRRTEFNQLVEL